MCMFLGTMLEALKFGDQRGDANAIIGECDKKFFRDYDVKCESGVLT